jgi:hypothetical protein
MRKLTLQLENLAVESFETGAQQEPRGTVNAHVSQFCTRRNPTCDGIGYTCDGGYTCGGDTCNFMSCDGACGSYNCVTDPSCFNGSCLGTCDQATCTPGCV